MKIIVLSEVPPKEKRQCHEWCIQVSVTLKQWRVGLQWETNCRSNCLPHHDGKWWFHALLRGFIWSAMVFCWCRTNLCHHKFRDLHLQCVWIKQLECCWSGSFVELIFPARVATALFLARAGTSFLPSGCHIYKNRVVTCSREKLFKSACSI